MKRLLSIVVALYFVLPSLAGAQMTGNVDRLKADLHGDNIDKAVAAASALGSLKTPQARDALMGGLQLGAPPKLLSALIEAIGLHKSPKTIVLMRHFGGNRNPIIRVAALKALGAITDKRIPRILISALGDSNPMVRAQAARLLGDRRDRVAERSLFKMLRRGDTSAAAPLGQVGGVETAKQLGELIGEVKPGALATAYGEMLKRKDFGPDPLRTEVVKALDKIPGAESTAALVEYVASVPPKEIRVSKKIAEQRLERRQK